MSGLVFNIDQFKQFYRETGKAARIRCNTYEELVLFAKYMDEHGEKYYDGDTFMCHVERIRDDERYTKELAECIIGGFGDGEYITCYGDSSYGWDFLSVDADPEYERLYSHTYNIRDFITEEDICYSDFDIEFLMQ